MLFALPALSPGCGASFKKEIKKVKSENDSLKKEIEKMKTLYDDLLAKNETSDQADDVRLAQKNPESTQYTVPPLTRIGHVHLKVSDLERSIAFYRDLLGFEVTMMYGSQAAFLSAGGYHHHIGLNTWTSKNAPRASERSVGLYHTAILFPTRRDLAVALDKLIKAGYPITGASDHGVSEAIYLDDPDGNGVELYWDRPRDQWPRLADGSITMYTERLDIESLMGEL